MNAKEYLKQLDWDSAIISATTEIDKNSPPPPVEAYIDRGYARCFKQPNVDKKYDEAIDDFSQAICIDQNKIEAYLYRAYAYYLNGNYERAKNDCKRIKNKLTNATDKIFLHELLGAIYLNNRRPDRAAKEYKEALKINFKNMDVSLSLIEKYKEACKKLNEA